MLLGTVNYLLNGHLWTGTNCPSYRESHKGSKERQEQTLGVRFTEVSVIKERVDCIASAPTHVLTRIAFR